MNNINNKKAIIKKRSRRAMTLKLKRDLIRLSDSGMRNCEICQKYNLSASTVATILKDKCRILEEVKKSTPLLSKIIRKRGGMIAEMETHLIGWIQDQLRQGISLTIREIQTKALRIFEEIKQNYKDSEETFQASKGWFGRFQNRHNLQWKSLIETSNTNDDTKESSNIFNDEKSFNVDDDIVIKQEEISFDETNLDHTQPGSPTSEILDDAEFFCPENSNEHDYTRWIPNNESTSSNNHKANHDSLDETNSTFSLSAIEKRKELSSGSNRENNNDNDSDSIDLLFKSYAKLLRKFTPKRQILVKSRIHQIFMDAELQELEDNTK